MTQPAARTINIGEMLENSTDRSAADSRLHALHDLL